jgi:arylsulfatase A-like enzyme
MILADELPAWILGCYGGAEIRTPNIDRIAQTGARFQRYYTSAPAAEPGRASLLTGRTAMQVANAPSAGAAASPLAAMLAGLGYQCHSTSAGAGEAVVAEAAGFLDQQQAGKPFLLIAGFSDLRPPYSGVPEKYAGLYATAKFESFFPADPPAANATLGREMLADPLASLRKAAGAVAALDAQVGALISKLAATGLLDGTLLIFASPDGSLLTRHGLWGSGDSSDPANMYQEAAATPMIWRWPARIPPQTTRTELVSSVDILPAVAFRWPWLSRSPRISPGATWSSAAFRRRIWCGTRGISWCCATSARDPTSYTTCKKTRASGPTATTTTGSAASSPLWPPRSIRGR